MRLRLGRHLELRRVTVRGVNERGEVVEQEVGLVYGRRSWRNLWGIFDRREIREITGVSVDNGGES